MREEDVFVSVGSSGEYVYSCKRCGFASFAEDDLTGHRCRWVRLHKVGRGLDFLFNGLFPDPHTRLEDRRPTPAPPRSKGGDRSKGS